MKKVLLSTLILIPILFLYRQSVSLSSPEKDLDRSPVLITDSVKENEVKVSAPAPAPALRDNPVQEEVIIEDHVTKAQSQIETSQLVEEGRPLKINNQNYGDLAYSGKFEELHKALETGLDINWKDEEGYSLLMESINGNCMDCFFELMARGADVNHQNKQGITPLGLAVGGGHGDMVKMLLDKGADANLLTNSGGFTHLMDAAMEGNINIARSLIESGALINAKDDEGMTALLYATREGFTEIVIYLIDQGANPYIKNNKGRNARSFAKSYNYPEMLEYLPADE